MTQHHDSIAVYLVTVHDEKAFEGNHHLFLRPSGLNFVLYNLYFVLYDKKNAHFEPKRALSQDTKYKFEQIGMFVITAFSYAL